MELPDHTTHDGGVKQTWQNGLQRCDGRKELWLLGQAPAEGERLSPPAKSTHADAIPVSDDLARRRYDDSLGNLSGPFGQGPIIRNGSCLAERVFAQVL